MFCSYCKLMQYPQNRLKAQVFTLAEGYYPKNRGAFILIHF